MPDVSFDGESWVFPRVDPQCYIVLPNEKRHLRLRPDYFRDPRSHRRRRQVDVVLGPWLRTLAAIHYTIRDFSEKHRLCSFVRTHQVTSCQTLVSKPFLEAALASSDVSINLALDRCHPNGPSKKPFDNSTYHIPFDVCDYPNGSITYYDLSIGFDSNLIVDEPCLKEVFHSGQAVVKEVVKK